MKLTALLACVGIENNFKCYFLLKTLTLSAAYDNTFSGVIDRDHIRTVDRLYRP